MATVINEREKRGYRLPDILLGILPPALWLELEGLSADGVPIDEIRVRVGRIAYVTSGGRNVALSCTVGQEQMDAMVLRICDGSLYAHANTICQGYVTLAGGIRVGIVGRASVEEGRVVGVYDVCGLCFRLPRRIGGVGSVVCSLLRRSECDGGILVYSPPGEGKTTLLRSVISQMSSGSGALRVVVVDTRGELGPFLDGAHMSVDVLSGYPKARGIEIAARSMNAELIVCDEIGDEAEVRAIIGAQNCGAPLLATAHASGVEGLLRRSGIAALHKACVFSTYVGIARKQGQREYLYTVTDRKEADNYFKDPRSADNSA
jgi:stage III sporulation protein AA